jgi:hypothetical protein
MEVTPAFKSIGFPGREAVQITDLSWTERYFDITFYGRNLDFV